MKRVRRYLFKRGKIYYYLQRLNGKQKWVSLRTQDAKTARDLADQIHSKNVMAAAGFGAVAKIQTTMRSVAAVMDFYVDAGCPKLNGKRRTDRQLLMETGLAENLKRHLGDKDPATLSSSDWEVYVTKRLKEYKNKKGNRTIDLEYNALNSAYRWARRHPDKTGIQNPPLPERPVRLSEASEVEHCREFQPENADELHRIAAHFMPLPGDPRIKSTVYGWLTLLSAMIGQRGAEMMHLRTDAKSASQPGFDDGEHLWLYRSKTHKGTAPFIKIGPELRACLDAHAEWKRKMFPGNPWFFPSPRKKGKPVEASSFRHAIQRAAEKLGLPKRTAHGLRSYYVNVLRSRGVSDSEIALRIGHKTGGKLIVETYGEVLPIKLGWMPKGKPAWEVWKDAEPIAQPKFG